MTQEYRLTGKLLGNYRLLSRLSGGSSGNVYLGQHAIFTNDPVVAIKVLHTCPDMPQEREHFVQEALLLKKLSHRHILPVIDAGIQDDLAYLVTAYASHGTLRAYLDQQQGQPLPFNEALIILIQIAQALHHAHQYNIVHRDLKPANVLFNARGEALLADFGLAATLYAAQSQHLNPGGTPAYMAPEQFEGIVSTKSDQYALGCIAYELLTGRKPFDVEYTNIEALWYQHAKVPPVPPSYYNPFIPPHVEQAILLALSKQRADRYADISLFADALCQPIEPEMAERYAQLEVVEQALLQAPEEAQLYLQKGNLLCSLKQYEYAAAVYSQALLLDAELALAYNNQGFALCRLKRYNEALAALEQAILLDGSYVVPYVNLSNTLCELQRYPEALSVIDYALRLEPDLASAYYHKGNALYGLQCYEEALVAYEEAARLKPDLAVAYHGKGNALHQLGRYGALLAYEQALRLDRKLAGAYKSKGHALLSSGLHEEALLAYEHALYLDGNDAELYVQKGDVLYTLQRYDEANTAYAQALRLNPDLNIGQSMREILQHSYHAFTQQAAADLAWQTISSKLPITERSEYFTHQNGQNGDYSTRPAPRSFSEPIQYPEVPITENQNGLSLSVWQVDDVEQE